MPGEPQCTQGYAALSQLLPECAIEPWEPVPPVPSRRFAGEDGLRAAAFNRMVEFADAEMLIAMRGGYGVTRILNDIDFKKLKASGKWLMGYSDTTALLLAAWHAGYRKLIHGPMLCSSFAAANRDTALLEAYRENLKQLFAIKSGASLLPSWHGASAVKNGTQSGQIVPCNLTMLEALIGTPFLSTEDFDGAILAIEDIAIPAHSIDRSLRHLLHCGILDRLNGLIFGTFTQCENDNELPEIIREYAECIRGPVIAGLRFGHTLPALALPVGLHCRLDCRDTAITLTAE